MVSKNGTAFNDYYRESMARRAWLKVSLEEVEARTGDLFGLYATTIHRMVGAAIDNRINQYQSIAFPSNVDGEDIEQRACRLLIETAMVTLTDFPYLQGDMVVRLRRLSCRLDSQQSNQRAS